MFNRLYAKLLIIICSIVFPSNGLAHHSYKELSGLFTQFEQLTLEKKISLVEDTIYIDYSNVQVLLDTLMLDFDSLNKDQQHRLMLVQAFLTFAGSDIPKTISLLTAVQNDNPNISNIGRLLYLQSRLAQYKGDFYSAFNLLNKADQLPKGQLKVNNEFFLLMLAADLNSFVARHDAAMAYNQRGTKLAYQLKNAHFVCFALAAKSKLLVEKKDYDALEQASYVAIEACQQSENMLILGDIYVDFSYIYMVKGNFKLQQQLLKRSIKIYQENASELSIPPTKLLLVNSYINNKQFNTAEILLEELFVFVAENWGESERKELYLAKSLLLEKQTMLNHALLYYKKYLSLEQQEFDGQLLIQPSYYQAQFETKFNQQVAEIAEAERAYLNEVSSVGNLQVWLFVIFSLFILSLPAYGLTFYHRHKKVSIIEGGKFDDLTSVLHFEQGLQKARALLRQQQADIKLYYVISVDIDFMKAINNSFSYDFGDRFIRAFAMSLDRLFCNYGITTRVRRNDFVIFISAQTEQQIIELIDDIHNGLRNLVIDKHRPNATCSIGYSCSIINELTDVSELCSNLVGQASIALRYAKGSGGDRWVKYDKQLTSQFNFEPDYSDFELEQPHPF